MAKQMIPVLTKLDRKLLKAAEAGDAEGVKAALANGANPNAVDDEAGEYPLFLAASAGSSGAVAALVAAGSDLEGCDEEGTTPLMHAALADDAESTRLLLKAGAKAKAKDRDGNTAIWYAADRGHEAVVDLLDKHSTPKERRKARARLRLLRQGPPPEEWRAVVDMLSPRRRFEEDIEGRFHAALSKVIAAGTGVDWPDEYGRTLLFDAANRGELRLVQALLDAGADANHEDVDGKVSLYWAAMGGRGEAFDLLHPLTTPKLRKSAEREAELVKQRRNWRYSRPDLAADLAAQGGRTAAVRRLLNAAEAGHIEKVRAELDAGVPPDAIEPDGTTPLMNAARYRHLDVVDLLLKRGADPNRTTVRGQSAAERAAGNAAGLCYERLAPLTSGESRDFADRYAERMKQNVHWKTPGRPGSLTGI